MQQRATEQPNWRSRGYLPHVAAPDLVQHVVFRLADSLPAGLRAAVTKLPANERVSAVAAALDVGYGKRQLAIPEIAALVEQALLSFDGERYVLIAWCVMPTHFHVLLRIASGYDLPRIVHSWKSYTAKLANRVLGRAGTFWAREYFDRFMRDEDHLARTAVYIEGNPVKAQLCETVSDWQFSSAWRGRCRGDAGGPSNASRSRV